jgi:hypothetical protein
MLNIPKIYLIINGGMLENSFYSFKKIVISLKYTFIDIYHFFMNFFFQNTKKL